MKKPTKKPAATKESFFINKRVITVQMICIEADNEADAVRLVLIGKGDVLKETAHAHIDVDCID